MVLGVRSYLLLFDLGDMMVIYEESGMAVICVSIVLGACGVLDIKRLGLAATKVSIL